MTVEYNRKKQQQQKRNLINLIGFFCLFVFLQFFFPNLIIDITSNNLNI